MRQLIITTVWLLLQTGENIQAAGAASWPQFRGSSGLGISPGSKPPIHFGPASNVLWKVAFPSGNSSPCIWGERIFLTGLEQGKLETLCVDRKSGQVLWRQSAPAEKLEPAHNLGSPATPTTATDGERVYAYFGSFGLLCYDFDGKEKWRHALPTPINEFGTSSSPLPAGNLLVLVCDQDLGSFLLAVDRRTGKMVWRTERSGFRRSFATPLLWGHDGIEEIIVPGGLYIKSYNLDDGAERWTVHGTSRIACASPVFGDGLLFSSSWNVGGDEGERINMPPFEQAAVDYDKNKDGKFTMDELPAGPVRERFSIMDLNKDGIVTPEEWQGMLEMFAKAENAVLAIRPGGKGDVTATHVAWKVTRSLPYVSSPLFYDGRLYTIKNGGLASCYDAKTGKVFYQNERLDAPGEYYASAVATSGLIYLASQNGVVAVMTAGDTLNVLARNNLGEQIRATPAIVEGKLYLRTAGHLYAFGQ